MDEKQIELLKKIAVGWETAAVKWEEAARAWERVAYTRGCVIIIVTVVAIVCAVGWVVRCLP